MKRLDDGSRAVAHGLIYVRARCIVVVGSVRAGGDGMRQVLRLAPAVLVAALLLAGCGQASAPVAPKATAAPAAVSLHLSAGPPAAEIGGSEYAVVLTVKGLVKGGTYGLNGGTSPWQLLANACVKDGLVVGGSTSCTIVVQGVTGTTKFTLQERSNVSNTVVVTW